MHEQPTGDTRSTASRPRSLVRDVAPGVSFTTTQIVNVVFLGEPGAGDRDWVLVDTGMPGSRARVERAAAARFGTYNRPSAIVLTHGHFDHVGSVRELAARWDVPVYAHELEAPYLTGRSSYPPADPTVGGGAMARLSGVFPRGPIDIGDRLQVLPADGTVPGLPDWRWLFTPGHAPGHVSLWRAADRTLVAGDAFVTVRQESAYAVLTQRREVHGPPAYFTPDWDQARTSVQALADMKPESAITGHGQPMAGAELRAGLDRLAEEFDRVARPARGRYVHEAARADASGVVSLPPAVRDPLPKIVAGVAAAALLGGTIAALRRRGREPRHDPRHEPRHDR